VAFTPPELLYELDFTGTELDGLTVQARSADIGWVLNLSAMLEGMGDMPDPDAEDAETLTPAKAARYGAAMESMRRLVVDFARVLHSWDLEIPAGTPVPATVEGLHQLNVRHLMMIIKAWKQAVSEVPADLGKDSPGGAPSPVASLPMEPLSESRAS
jgi:hypothetical protein